MKTAMRPAGALAALVFLLGGAGCTPPPGNTNGPSTPTAPSSGSGPATPAPVQNVSDEKDTPVTLPVLDAMLYDDAFRSDLKSKLQLTDEQIEKVKTIAHEGTAKLREADDASDDDARSTAEAARAAQTEISGAIDEEKSKQLFDLARQRWNDGGEGGVAAGAPAGKPGNIPTDTRIVVNAPAYRMDVWEDGKLAKSYKVGIGYPEFPLPTGMRKASEIIFNPSWTPPDEPWVESGKSKVKVGEKVEPGDSRNPLGPIKIPIGLPSLIHGGKSPAKLGGFASHGCVGLTTPQVQEFARTLAEIGGADLTPEQIAAIEKNKNETKSVKLGKAIPVELRYETITVEDGKLHVYRDVYDKNTNTEANLQAVLSAYGVDMGQLSETERSQALTALREMSRDAQGRLDPAAPGAGSGSAPAASNTNAKSGADAAAKKPEAKGGPVKVTQAVKGKKEIVVEIAALAGKGYPAPATGGATKADAAKAGATPATDAAADKKRGK